MHSEIFSDNHFCEMWDLSFIPFCPIKYHTWNRLGQTLIYNSLKSNYDLENYMKLYEN